MEKETNFSAPKDPKKRGTRLYLLDNALVESSLRADGKFAEEIYLNGRLSDKVRVMNNVEDKEFLTLFDTAAGFRKAVAGMGVCVEDADDCDSVEVQLWMYGKGDRYQSGTHISCICPTDGSETQVWFDEIAWNPQDDLPGQFRICFPREEMTARVSWMIYLREGFSIQVPEREEPLQMDTPEYRAMIERSLVSLGNGRRLKEVLERGKAGEKIRIAFIGGSITQGAAAKPIHT